jgi:DNA-binding CsgD family transcriptional regulator
MKKSAIVSESRLLRDIAEIAAEAESFETFRQATLVHLLSAVGAEVGAFCTNQMTGAAGSSRFSATTWGQAPADSVLETGVREILPEEFDQAMATTVLDSEVLGARRRDRLLLYREYLPALGVGRYAIRVWRDGGTYHWISLACRGAFDERRFINRAAAAVDAVLPVLRLGARAHAATTGVQTRTETLSNDRAFGLTKSEAKVAALLERGLTNREIAAMLGLSPNTVRNRVASAFQRVGASRRAELVYLLREAS